jgi:dihydroorotate dehydrogenase
MDYGWRTKVAPYPVKTAFGELSNPVGAPAGYDKTGKHLSALAKLGFGYVVAGTFTLEPRPGNPKPRVVRKIPEEAIVNSLGFPNPGIDAFIGNVSKRKPVVPILASISGSSVPDVVECYSRVQPHVEGVEVNLSSPNTPSLRDLRELPAFTELARKLSEAKKVPTYLKTPPYIDDGQFAGVLAQVRLWESLGFEGVTASNTLPVAEPLLAMGRGGYSGPSLLSHTLSAIRAIRGAVSPRFEINAVGGIGKASDVAACLALGATTVQIFTAVVYSGPGLVKRVLADLAAGTN